MKTGLWSNPRESVLLNRSIPLQEDSAQDRRPRILLADDEALVRVLVERVLSGQGWQVTAVSSGSEAVKAWEASHDPFDLVILDVNMPGLNGYDAYCEICRGHPRPRCLFVSGYATEAVQRKITQQGLPLIQKPFSPPHLVSRVRELLTC
jgi:two-component system, cell cycle sensor histidine kinase and response regulator CckA